MQKFVYEYATKVYFGEGAAKEHLAEAGKKVTDFSGIMSNPAYAKVQEGAKLAKEADIDFIVALGGGSVIDCCKIIAAQAKTVGDGDDRSSVPHGCDPDGSYSYCFRNRS